MLQHGKREFATIACSTLLALGMVACSSQPPAPAERTGTTTAAWTTPPPDASAPAPSFSAPPINTFVLYAENGISIGDNSDISGGNVGVLSVAPAGSGPQLTLGGYVVVQSSEGLFAPTVSLGINSSVGTLHINSLSANENGRFRAIESFPTAYMPLPPAPLLATPGTNAVTVAGGQIQTLSGGGDFNALTVNAYGQLVLMPGTYSFESVTMGEHARLLAGAPGVQVLVAGTFTAARWSTIGSIAPHPSASDLSISVFGPDTLDKLAFDIFPHSTIQGLLAAEIGTLFLENTVVAKGAFFGRNVLVGQIVSAIFESGFTGPPAAPDLSLLSFLDETGEAITSPPIKVPTNNAFAFAVFDDTLPGATMPIPQQVGSASTVQFTASGFPPDQQVVLFDQAYGLGSEDIGGSQSPSDNAAGDWPCAATHFVSLQGGAGLTVSAPLASPFQGVAHVIRYVDGTCRLRVPFQPLFQSAQAQVVQAITNDVPGVLSPHFYLFSQPQFRGDASNLQAGFLSEGQFSASFLDFNAQISFDPAYSFGVSSDGLWQVTVLNINVSAVLPPKVAGFDPAQLLAELRTDITNVAIDLPNAVNARLTVPAGNILSEMGLNVGPVTCTMPTPNAASSECAGTVKGLLAHVTGSPLATVAIAALQDSNFTCSSGVCDFHPILQAVNVLPNDVEFVLSPDLSTGFPDDLTPFYSALSNIPAIGSIAITLPTGGSIPVTLDCSPLPEGPSQPGHIATVFSGDPTFAMGIPCGGFLPP
jgi:hypothetical protein